MRILRPNSRRLERSEIFPVVKNIHRRAGAMAAFDDHAFSAHIDNLFRCRFDGFAVVRSFIPVSFSASGILGVTTVASGKRWERSAATAFLLNQQIAGGCHHHRVDDDIFQAMLANLLARPFE